MKFILIALLRGYQKFISPYFAPRCKYYPTCSQYSIDAIKQNGSLRGVLMTTWRLIRCNPFSHGGVDYADPKKTAAALSNETTTTKVGI